MTRASAIGRVRDLVRDMGTSKNQGVGLLALTVVTGTRDEKRPA